ncbi:PLAC8 family-domain-containing protein [Aspergillus novoparasiticus]|uniref:PLAC8 family-domain-containing protein n=1 Tax=Aspergillus novoparasiticus TaxID=986946 RepID=A0A5N6EI69_9EURO|nr:PLAC8 family-domain-containing protein [Aspergillus novoparasiticus]
MGASQSSSSDQLNKWSHSIWGCCSPTRICLLGCCCPCFLYGKTQSRLNDPALQEHTYLNGDCCLYTVTQSCGLHCLILARKRTDLRKRYRLSGGVCGDCLQAWCCSSCVLIQHEKEIEKQCRTLTYQQPPTMIYPEPR